MQMRGPVTAAAAVFITAVTFSVAPLIKQFEGERVVAYADIANPKIATICYGETQGVKFGDVKTVEECHQLLMTRLPDYIWPVYQLMPNVPVNRAVAYTSLAWNAGTEILTRQTKDSKGKPVQGTSIVELENSGSWQKACARIKVFVYANGKKLKGLVNRRAVEYKQCMGDLDA